jgi:hypothetical protein
MENQGTKVGWECWFTFTHFHIGDGLPLVHGDEPRVAAAMPPAAEIYDQLALVTAEGGKDGVQAGLGESAVGEEEGGDDDLGEGVGQHVYFLKSL